SRLDHEGSVEPGSSARLGYCYSCARLGTSCPQYLVCAQDRVLSRWGRKPMIGAVDIGGTKLAVGLVDESGNVLAKNEIVTGSDSSYSAGLEKIAGMFREMERYARVEITGIGIGSTGPVDPLTGELGDVDLLPDWRWKNPVRDLAQLFGVNVALENDADAGVLGEAAWGAGWGKSRLVYITVGTGIGGGIV